MTTIQDRLRNNPFRSPVTDQAADRIDALERALELAANRLTWCSGITQNDKTRVTVDWFAEEARAALSGEGE